MILVPLLLAANSSTQPYIDQLKSQMQQNPNEQNQSSESYTEKEKKKLEEQDAKSGKSTNTNTTGQSYIDSLKAKNPSLNPAPANGYSDEQQRQLGPDNRIGAIEALKEGKSDLHPRFSGDVHNAFGLRYGVTLTRTITAKNSEQAFNTIYGNNYAPDAEFFYEWQPLYSEHWGSLGIFFNGGLSYFSGQGVFQYPLSNAGTGTPGVPGTYTPFSLTSQTSFQFFTAPVMVGLAYRFNLFHYLRPYAVVAPGAIGYAEIRSDSVGGSTGCSSGLLTEAGVSILISGLSSEMTWELYKTYSIKHYYLTVSYSKLTTINGDVNIGISGLYAGITFEY